MNKKPFVRRKLCQTKLSFEKLRADASSNDSDDEEGSESKNEASDEDERANVNFLCEFCDSNGCNRIGFQSRDGLITHCLKCHPTACLGCFEIFAGTEDLLQHLETFPHEPPVCRHCRRSFESMEAKSIHRCLTTSSSSKFSVLHKKANKNSIKDCSSVLKAKPQDEVEDEEDKADIAYEEIWIDTKIGFNDEEEERENDEITNKHFAFFLCEMCISNGFRNRRFKTKKGLITHCLKCHPNGCVGCFQMFVSSEDLLQHLEDFPHEPPVCRNCCRIFGSAKGKSNHRCASASSPFTDNLQPKVLPPCGKTIETLSKQKITKVKEEPKDSEDETENEDFLSNESESDIVDEYVEEEEVEDYTSDDEYWSHKQSSRSGVHAWRDAAIGCMHCSFIAEGCEKNPSLCLLRNHTCVAHPNVCLACFESFDCIELLTEHQKLMEHNIYSCCISCGLAYCSKRRYLDHLRRKHPDQCPIRCSECPFGAFNEHAMKVHTRRLHKQAGDISVEDSEEKHKNLLPQGMCPVCDFRAVTEFAVMMHMYDKHPEPDQVPKFKCEECQLAFSRPYSYCGHIRKKHWEEPRFRIAYRELKEKFSMTFECEPCQKYSFDLRNSFIQHVLLVHRSSMPYECLVCNLGFLDPIDLRVHNYQHHRNSSPYICDSCERSFVDLDRLVLHLNKVHKLTTMPYAYCFKHEIALYGRRNYMKHMSNAHYVKSKDRKFLCEQCGKILTTTKGLKVHIESHRTGRTCLCKFCGKAFANAVNLSNHEKMHSTDHQCATCKKTFHSAALLKRHANVHTGEKPFECSICGLKVSQSSALKRHMDKVHPGGIVGNPRSTKPRKCRTLAKALAKRKEEESAILQDADTEREPLASVPSAGSRSMKPEAQAEQTSDHSDKPDVQLDSDLLCADLQTKPQPILLVRKRRRSSVSSNDDRRDLSILRPRKVKVKVEPPRKRRRRGARSCGDVQGLTLWKPSSESSSSSEDTSADCSNKSDEPYKPRQRRHKSSNHTR